MTKEVEKVCGNCLFFRLESYPFIGKGSCRNRRSEYCCKRTWDDDYPCDFFKAKIEDEQESE